MENIKIGLKKSIDLLTKDIVESVENYKHNIYHNSFDEELVKKHICCHLDTILFIDKIIDVIDEGDDVKIAVKEMLNEANKKY